MSNYRKRAFWEVIKRSREGSGMRVGMPKIDAVVAEGYVTFLEAENEMLRRKYHGCVGSLEAAFQEGWYSGQRALSEAWIRSSAREALEDRESLEIRHREESKNG